MHKATYHKKRRIAVLVLIALLLIAAGAFMTIFTTAKGLYWSNPHLQYALLPLEEYDEITDKNDSALNETEAIVHRCNEEADPLGEGKASAFLKSCDQAVIGFFRDVYGVDVSERLNSLEVMKAHYREEVSQMVGGSYSDDFPERLFLNGDVLDSFESEFTDVQVPELTETEFSAKMLRTVYIHEVMHYLGFNSDDIFDHFTEALAECMSKRVMLHNGIKYEDITGYRDIQGFAAQIVECDPELVKGVLTHGDFDLSGYFNNRLGGGQDTNYAEYYDRLIGLVRQKDLKDSDRLKYYAQYLTYEYCKAVDPCAEKTLRALDEGTVSLFEIKWVFFTDKNS